jgi:hypothetical protein
MPGDANRFPQQAWTSGPASDSNAVFGRRPRKVSTLKNLVEQAEALAIPPQQLDPISAFTAEAEDGTHRPRGVALSRVQPEPS